MYESGQQQPDPPAFLTTLDGLGPPLMKILMAPEILPGSDPGYELCKTIYSYHVLGAILTDAPYRRAQAKPREESVKVLGEDRLLDQRKKKWHELGRVGGTVLLFDLFSTARRYGIASLGVGEVGVDPAIPLDITKVAGKDLFFSIFDPLNTSGSLVLNQDPNSPNFLKPMGPVRVNGKEWHTSRLSIKMHGRPIFIEYTNSAFGFVGRSVYQPALFPLKTFIQSMLTDQMVVQKSGLLIYKAQSPSAFIDQIMQWFMGLKRSMLKQGNTGQVLSIGVDEAIETLNMQNLDTAFTTARTNVLRNIASAAGMPASIIAQETLTEGFGEGTEDFKKEVEYLDNIREEMDPHYAFLDEICNRQAWNPEFYETLRGDYKTTYGEGGYDRALETWLRAYRTKWPNLLTEPDSEKIKTEDVQMKTAIAVGELVLPEGSPAMKSQYFAWLAEQVNNREKIFASGLDFDLDEMETFFEEKGQQDKDAAEASLEEPKPTTPFKATA